MDREDRLKLMYEKAIEQHLFLLGWRDKLLAGYIAVFGALIYFAANHNDYVIHACIAGIVITIIILFLSARNTMLYWQSRNSAYYFEKELIEGEAFEGFYDLSYPPDDDTIKADVDKMVKAKKEYEAIKDISTADQEKKDKAKNEYKRLRDKLYNLTSALKIIKPWVHIGAINCTYYLSLLGFLLKLLYEINYYYSCGFHCM